MTKRQSETITAGARIVDNKYVVGLKGTVQGKAAGPAGYWNINWDDGTQTRIGYRHIDFV